MTDRRILVVDDEEHLRELVHTCLEDLGGWETLVAGSGEECLQIDPITRSIRVILLTAKVWPIVLNLPRWR